MTRLSCCFCIMSSDHDIRTAAALMPDLFKKYCEKEKELGFTMMMPAKGKQRFLEDIVKGVIN